LPEIVNRIAVVIGALSSPDEIGHAEGMTSLAAVPTAAAASVDRLDNEAKPGRLMGPAPRAP
jgi:hypothetical protein